jgi:hypothetical protein
MDLKVPCLGLVDNFDDVVHRSLDDPDPPGGGGSGAPTCSRSSGPEGTSKVRDPTTVWSLGPEAASGGRDPVSPWAGQISGSWDPAAPSVLDSSRDPRS